MEHSIRIRNLGKRYKLYASRRDRLKDWLLPFGTEHRYEEKWVLKDINLDIAPGEAVGLVGMNGAGKSTLLKIVTGTTIPTTGTVELSGKVSALLELGLGFHPDFTGRQNVYMSGQLLGYSSQEITECMKDIEAFAEIGEAIDEPVRTYSSGMQIRLAFSVATMKRPDILIVDEALSVGDAYFQHKSFARIREFKEEGTTLLFVSHDMGAVQSICDRAVLIDRGVICRVGSPLEVIDYYNALLGGSTEEKIHQENKGGQIQTLSGNGKARIRQVQIFDRSGQESAVFTVGEEAHFQVLADIIEPVEDLTCGIMIRNRLGETIYGTNTDLLSMPEVLGKKGESFQWDFSTHVNLGEGSYSLTVALHRGKSHSDECYEWRDLAAIFEVIHPGAPLFSGVAYLPVSVRVVKPN